MGVFTSQPYPRQHGWQRDVFYRTEFLRSSSLGSLACYRLGNVSDVIVDKVKVEQIYPWKSWKRHHFLTKGGGEPFG